VGGQYDERMITLSVRVPRESVPMAGEKVLIAFGSRYGCTAEVALELAKALREEGISPQMLDLGQTKPKEWPSLGDFDGVLVGTGIKIGRWTKEALRFLGASKDELIFGGMRLGAFVCCIDVLKDPEGAERKYCTAVMERAGVKVDACGVFPGVIDLSASSKLGFIERKMATVAGPEMVKGTGHELRADERNDYRDWDAIRKFAREFASKVLG
jgi:menaquinone-dependent protoporphyrinogen oxidase